MKKKAVLLSGPPGIGKTSSALIVCRELGFEPVEVRRGGARRAVGPGACAAQLHEPGPGQRDREPAPFCFGIEAAWQPSIPAPSPAATF